MVDGNALFGSRRLTQVLLLIALLDETRSRDCTVSERSFEVRASDCRTLDEADIIGSLISGEERRVFLNRR